MFIRVYYVLKSGARKSCPYGNLVQVGALLTVALLATPIHFPQTKSGIDLYAG